MKRILQVAVAAILLMSMLIGTVPALAGDCVNGSKHKWSSWKWENPNGAPDCQHTDLQMRFCSKCHLPEEREAKGDHNWGKWKTVTKGNCIQYGQQKRTCKVCGKH